MAVSLFIAGDVVPKGIQPDEFISKGELIFGEMKPYITGADFSIVNLEAPIVRDKPSPIKKSGPCLGVAPSTIEVLKNAGFSVFTLANNHFFDQDQKGVDNTISECNRLNVLIVGGGKTSSQARKPLFLEKGGTRIAIINACEQEFSIADHTHGGSNPLDLINMQEDIVTIRKEADYIVLVLHGGIEQYHYPTPRMKRWYRHFVDLGADAVINHHQHCINGYEVYKGKPIFYGLGNFYFPWGSQVRPDSWHYGYAVQLVLSEDIGFELIPYRQTVDAITLRVRKEFENEIQLLNLPIQDDFLLQQKMDEFIIDRELLIKTGLFPSFLRHRLITALANRGRLGKLYKKNEVFSVKNRLTCESHYETLQRLFTILLK